MRLLHAIALVLTLFLLPDAQAQSLAPDQVPTAVKDAFHTRFPTVQSTAWKLKPDKHYEAEFTLKKTESAVQFDASGKWLETESAISRSKVPRAVRNTADRRFKDYKVVETQTVQRWNEKSPVYELHLENSREIVKAQFSAEGVILKQSAKPKPSDLK
jgi:hypothetical protein